MTIFIILCVVMSAAALALIARPLLRLRAATPTLFVVAALVPIVSVAVYWKVGHRTWERDQSLAQTQAVAQQDLAANIARLEQQLREKPDDVTVILSLAEALVSQDERALAGRGGELVELALVHAPNNAKALWYGAINALAAGKLPIARERLLRVLAQNPPDNIRTIIERQVQDIEQQLGEKPAAPTHAISIQVSLQPELAQAVDKSTSLFILARDPVNGGPPLAVARRVVGDLPLTVTFTDNDAMMAGHGISSVPRVQLVARISKSGTPQAQAGDLFGEAVADVVAARTIAVNITIDRRVEK